MKPIDPKTLRAPTPKTGRGRPINPIAEAMKDLQKKTTPKVK
jgi:hypothetical protein